MSVVKDAVDEPQIIQFEDGVTFMVFPSCVEESFVVVINGPSVKTLLEMTEALYHAYPDARFLEPVQCPDKSWIRYGRIPEAPTYHVMGKPIGGRQ